MNGLDKVNISSATSALRQKLQASFLDLIPEEKWNELVKAEWIKFTAEERGYHGNKPSELQSLIKKEFELIATTKIKEVLSNPEWQAQWPENISKQVNKLILEHRDELVEAMLKSMMGTSIQTLLSSLNYNIIPR